MTQKSNSSNDAAIVTFRRNDYRIDFRCMNKSKSVNRMKNTDLSEKSRQLWLSKKYYTDVT